MRTCRYTFVLLSAALLVLGGPLASAEEKRGAGSGESAFAHEHLVAMLERAPKESINFVVESYDEGKMLLDLCADTYFDKGLESLGGSNKAGLLAASILDAWKDHKVRWEEKTFFASEAFVVDNALRAERLGALLNAVASIIVRLEEGGARRLSARATAGRIFGAVVPEAGESGSILDQYYLQIMEISQRPIVKLREFAVVVRS